MMNGVLIEFAQRYLHKSQHQLGAFGLVEDFWRLLGRKPTSQHHLGAVDPCTLLSWFYCNTATLHSGSQTQHYVTMVTAMLPHCNLTQWLTDTTFCYHGYCPHCDTHYVTMVTAMLPHTTFCYHGYCNVATLQLYTVAHRHNSMLPWLLQCCHTATQHSVTMVTAMLPHCDTEHSVTMVTAMLPHCDTQHYVTMATAVLPHCDTTFCSYGAITNNIVIWTLLGTDREALPALRPQGTPLLRHDIYGPSQSSCCQVNTSHNTHICMY